MVLRAQITRLNEIHDAPEVEQAVFQRRAGQREALVGAKLFDRLGDLRGGVFNELSLVEDDGAELEFLKRCQIAPEQGVIGDNEIVLGNLFAQIVARGPAFQHEHFEVRREPV